MDPATLQDTSRRQAGVTWTVAPQGTAPEIRAILARFQTKVAAIPWVPRDWLTRIERLSITAPGDQFARLYGPYQGGSKGGGVLKPDIPDWLDTTEKREKWQALADEEARILKPVFRRELAAARQAVEESESRVEFWTNAAKVTETIRDLPATAVNAVADGAVSAIGGNLGKLLSNPSTLLLLAAAGAFVWWKYVRRT